jgi:chaperonin GroES
MDAPATSMLSQSQDTQDDSAPSETQLARFARWLKDPTQPVNIAKELPQDKLNEIGGKVLDEYQIDLNSMDEWREEAEEALELAMQRSEPKTYPWKDASNIIYPLVTQAADQFAARAYPGIIPNNSVVKGIVAGDDSGIAQIDPNTNQPALDQNQKPVWQVQPGMKAKRADRIGQHMSWQLLEDQEEWEPDTDMLIHVLPIMGCCFRKTFFDPVMKQNASCYLPGTRLIVNYKAKSVNSAPRLTEECDFYPYEIKEKEISGEFIKATYIHESKENDPDASQEFLEQHRRLDLDDDGYGEPYIVTVHKSSRQVVRIVANWDADQMKLDAKRRISSIKPVSYYTKYDFLPNREGGFYGQGFGQLLKPINEGINTTLNMMLDSGHLANVGGGFIGRGISMHSGTVTRRPGEWVYVNAPGGNIREALVPLVHPGPSTVLFSLLGTLQNAGKEISSVQDILTGEIKAQTMSPTVFQALVEQGLKVFTAIFKRIHRALKSEYRKIFRLNRIYLGESAEFEFGGKWVTVTQEDYQQAAGVAPISDPTMIVDAQKMARSQILAQFKDDQYFDGIEIRRRILETAGITDADKLLRSDPGPDAMFKIQMVTAQTAQMEIKAKTLLSIARAINQLAHGDKFASEAHGNFQEFVANELQQMETIVSGLGQPQQAPTGQQPAPVPAAASPT